MIEKLLDWLYDFSLNPNAGAWEELLDAAVSEIEYSIKTKHTKSEEVREHYLTNAIRYIEEAKEVAE